MRPLAVPVGAGDFRAISIGLPERIIRPVGTPGTLSRNLGVTLRPDRVVFIGACGTGSSIPVWRTHPDHRLHRFGSAGLFNTAQSTNRCDGLSTGPSLCRGGYVIVVYH